MPFTQKVTLPGSQRNARPGYRVVGNVDPQENVTVSVILRRKSSPSAALGEYRHPERLSRASFDQQAGAEPKLLRLVAQFAEANGLQVVESNGPKRRVVLTGPAAAHQKAFETDLQLYQGDAQSQTFRGRTGSLSIPAELKDAVIAVLGLDNRPVAKPHHRKRKKKAAPASAGPFVVSQLGALYDFPAEVDGTGQTIGIIELGGGYNTSDLSTFFGGLGLKTPTVTAVGVDGGSNSPGGDADTEVMLDIEVAGALANGSNIAVYFTPNTEQGFVDAVTDAAHDTTNKTSVISISWGGPEDSFTQQGQTALNAALQDAATLGVTVTVAAGDSGSSDGAGDGKLHVDFPASSPYVLACGGTTLTASGTSISSETVWNETAKQEGATGGGVSTVFAIPSYQASAHVPVNPETQFAGRGVPDVAGDADPSTGYEIVAGGQSEVVGGTSAVAPLWAALIARINQKLGRNLGFINPSLYSTAAAAFHDITSGNNDDSKLGHYNAGTGWDPCTGLGSPNGTAILNALQSSSAAGSGQ